MDTSVFPGKARYVLPVKRSIRAAEALDVADMATVTVELVDFAWRPHVLVRPAD